MYIQLVPPSLRQGVDAKLMKLKRQPACLPEVVIGTAKSVKRITRTNASPINALEPQQLVEAAITCHRIDTDYIRSTTFTRRSIGD